MPANPAAVEVLTALAGVMDARGDRWYLFGALAVAAYGVPRMTVDVDVTVAIGDDQVRPFVESMQKAGFELRVDDLDDFVRRTRVIPFGHTVTGVPLDVILSGSPLEEEFLDRSRRLDLGGVSVPVISAEDLLATKMLAGRAKDIEDVRGILRARGTRVNLPRVRDLLRQFELALDRSDLVGAFAGLIREAGFEI